MRQAISLIVAAWLASPLPAQAPAGRAAGARVRVMQTQADGLRAELARGDLRRLAGDTVELVRGDTVVRISLGQGGSLEEYAGRYSKMRQGFAIGFGIGAVAGLALASGAVDQCQPNSFTPCMRGMEIAFGGLLLGTVGGIVGSVIGWQVGHEKWVPVPHAAQGLDLRLTPSRQGVMLGATLHF